MAYFVLNDEIVGNQIKYETISKFEYQNQKQTLDTYNVLFRSFEIRISSLTFF